MLLRSLLLISLIGLVVSYETYQGYQVLTSSPVKHHQLASLRKLENDAKFDFLHRPRVDHPLHVMTSPNHVTDLYTALNNLGLDPQPYISDHGEWVAREREEWEEIKRTETRSSREVTFDRYMELDEIFAYMDEVTAAHPDIASIEDAGLSYEGRPLRMVKVSTGPGKQAVFLDAGFHPREYMGPPLALKAIFELVENTAQNQDLVDAFDWYILPSVNPDGYVYTFNGGRMWRKTRSLNNGSDCIGTDPNRNFDFHWGEDGDTDMCSQTYHGLNAFSESESAAVAQVLQDKDILVYLTTHTFGSFLLHPWGWTYDLPPNVDELTIAGNAALDAIRAYNGTEYVVGSAANVYFPGFGASDDYAYAIGEVPFSYTWELRAGGITGFDPPNNEIAGIAFEAWEGCKAIVRSAAEQTSK